MLATPRRPHKRVSPWPRVQVAAAGIAMAGALLVAGCGGGSDGGSVFPFIPGASPPPRHADARSVPGQDALLGARHGERRRRADRSDRARGRRARQGAREPERQGRDLAGARRQQHDARAARPGHRPHDRCGQHHRQRQHAGGEQCRRGGAAHRGQAGQLPDHRADPLGPAHLALRMPHRAERPGHRARCRLLGRDAGGLVLPHQREHLQAAGRPHGRAPGRPRETTTNDGTTVPYIVRVESGTINRGVYRLAVLDNPRPRMRPPRGSPARAGTRSSSVLRLLRLGPVQPGRAPHRDDPGRRRPHPALARLRLHDLDRALEQPARQPAPAGRDADDAEGARHRGPSARCPSGPPASAARAARSSST
jgi:hypothetical protein